MKSDERNYELHDCGFRREFGRMLCRFASLRGTKQSKFVSIQALAPQILKNKIRVIRAIRS